MMITTNNSQVARNSSATAQETVTEGQGAHRRASSMAKSYDSNAPSVNKKVVAL